MPQAPVRPQRHRSDRGQVVAMPKPRDSWESALGNFLGDCRRRHLSAATIENYEWWLAGPRLSAYREQQGIMTPEQLTADLVEQFETELVDAGLKPSSVDSFHRHIKNFLGYCIRKGYGGDPGALAIQGPKMDKVEPETFTEAEEKALRAALKDRPRDLMMIDLLLRTGLRLQEVANLTVDDIILDDPRGAFVLVKHGKGGKDRAVPLDTPKDKLSARLDRYIAKVRPKSKTSRALFLSERGDAPLSASAIQTLMKRLSRDTDIHINPHKFRHTAATRALSAGLDIMALQRILGHTTLTMVSRYVHYAKEDLLAASMQRRD